MQQSKSVATFGGGCFWCTEACLQNVKGMLKVVSGYAGGTDKTPNYKKICDGSSDHAEVIQCTFDEAVVSYHTVLKAFFKSHDPTTLNRQGNDSGPQYRSIILYHDQAQHDVAKKMIQELNTHIYGGKVVTILQKFEHFYPAEEYHQNYFNTNPEQGYCRGVIKPKLAKFLQTLQE